MNELATHSLVDGAIATGLGLFIGLEREHSETDPAVSEAHGEGPRPPRTDQLGVRTFALLALFGWLCGMLQPAIAGFALVGLAAVSGLVLLQYVRTWRTGAGITTEAAAFVTFGLGLLVRHNRLLAVSAALVATLLLIAKPWVRRFVRRIDRRELMATLQLAIMLAVVLPLLPAQARDPWGVLAPRRIGLFVVLIAGISFVGYVLSRLFGAKHAAGLSGLLGGIASSTAVTASMAQRARVSPALTTSAQLTTFLANAVMFMRVLVVSAIISRGVASPLAPPMMAMSAVMLAGALWKWRELSRNDGGRPEGEIRLQNPFALLPALKWGALLAVILVVVAIAREKFGARGLVLAAAISGFADVDAITLAVTRQAAHGTMDVDLGVLAITIATISNTITKGTIALVTGRAAFGRSIAAVFAASIAAGLIALLLT